MVDPAAKPCSVDRGTPGTTYFNAECGYCGEKGKDGKYVRRGWMTADNCPLAFTCSNGIYAAYVEGTNGKYTLGVATITDPCKEGASCAASCPKPAEKHAKHVGQVPPAPGKVAQCTDTGFINNQVVYTTVTQAWDKQKGAAKTELKLQGKVDSKTTILFSPDKNPQVLSTTLEGKPASIKISMTGVNVHAPAACFDILRYPVQ
jgi:hypothetical protein